MKQLHLAPVLFSLCCGLLTLSGCNNDRNQTKLQYMPDMADSPTVKAQENFIDPPEHSLATNAIIYPDDPVVAETELPHNLPKTEENLAKGKVLYDTYCAVCHGEKGNGPGYLGTSYPTQPPDISRAEIATRKDGFFFMLISKGRGLMPGYGYATTHTERWQIISYLRTLQQKP